MPKFGFNPKDASAGFPLIPPGEIEVKLGECKAFYGSGKNNKADNHGVRFIGVIQEGESKGKKYLVNCYQHSDSSKDFAKQIQMAALGFSRDQEQQFNEQFGDRAQWAYDTDDGSCGDGWHAMSGQTIIVTNANQPNPETADLQNNIKGIRPFSI